MKHLGTVSLETKRLNLRKCRESDYKEAYIYCCSDSELCRLQGFDVHKSDDTTKRSFKEKEERYKIDSTFYEWAVVNKETDTFMGEVALVHYNETNNSFETGYHLGRQFRGQGYMNEAINEILRFAFCELKCDLIFALIQKDNLCSQKTVLSCNFEYVCTVDDYKDDVYEGPIDRYEISRDKWLSLN